MKLKNKKTGEIIEFDAILPVKDVAGDSVAHLEYGSLAELNAEWEDVPEEPKKPKEYWYIADNGEIEKDTDDGDAYEERMKEIGNYFSSREEAEKAVEKLKAWKRLKDKGFRFDDCKIEISEIVVPEITITAFIDTEEPETLNLVNLLFGGEE